MKNGMKDKIIEEWMQREYPEMSDIRDLELAEGVNFVCQLGRLLDIAEENLKPSDNSRTIQSAFKHIEDCPTCHTPVDMSRKKCDNCGWEAD